MLPPPEDSLLLHDPAALAHVQELHSPASLAGNRPRRATPPESLPLAAAAGSSSTQPQQPQVAHAQHAEEEDDDDDSDQNHKPAERMLLPPSSAFSSSSSLSAPPDPDPTQPPQQEQSKKMRVKTRPLYPAVTKGRATDPSIYLRKPDKRWCQAKAPRLTFPTPQLPYFDADAISRLHTKHAFAAYLQEMEKQWAHRPIPFPGQPPRPFTSLELLRIARDDWRKLPNRTKIR